MHTRTKEEPRVLFTFRVALPDRPGALAQLTSVIASHAIDVRAIDVLGGKLTEAVDEFLLDGDAERVDALAADLRRGGTFTVMGVRRAGITKENLPELAVVQAVAKQPDRALGILTEGAPRLLDADWAVGIEQPRRSLSEDSQRTVWLLRHGLNDGKLREVLLGDTCTPHPHHRERAATAQVGSEGIDALRVAIEQ